MSKSIRLNKELRATIIHRIMEAWKLANPCNIEKLDEWKVIKKELFTPATNDRLIRLFPKVVELSKDPEIKPLLADCSCHRNIVLPNGNYSAYIYLEELEGVLYPLPSKFCDGMLFDYSQENLPKWAEEAVKTYKEKISSIKENNKKLKEWEKDKELYQEEISNIIFNVNTTGQLLEVWPEVEKFLPVTAVNPSKTQLPAVSIKKLNQALKGV